MTSIVARISMFVAALAATAAIGAPSTLASPTGLPVTPKTPGAQGRMSTVPPPNLPYIDHSVVRFQRVAAYHRTGFNWTAAGIGALAAAGACVVLFGVTVDIRRRRHPTMA